MQMAATIYFLDPQGFLPWLSNGKLHKWVVSERAMKSRCQLSSLGLQCWESSLLSHQWAQCTGSLLLAYWAADWADNK